MLRWLLLSLVLFGCDDPADEPFTPGPGGGLGMVQTNPDSTLVRNVPDAAAIDAVVMPDPDDGVALDMSVAPPPDMASADVGPDAAAPMCTRNEDCTRAVLLDACDACPVPMTRDELARTRCAAEFVAGQAFSTYEPAACREACPAGTLEFCDGRIFAVRCTDGACVNIQ